MSVVIVAAILGFVLSELAVHSLVAMGESNNQALTRLLANSLSAQLTPYLAAADAMPTERLAVAPGPRTIRRRCWPTHLRGLTVVKVKVYDMGGRTVFSTDANQIGEDKSSNPGFQAARFGSVTSELTHRDEFSAFDRIDRERRPAFDLYPRAPRDRWRRRRRLRGLR